MSYLIVVYLGCSSIVFVDAVSNCSEFLGTFMDIVVFVDGVDICNVFIDVVSCCVNYEHDRPLSCI